MALSGTHTHAGPSGYLQYLVYDIASSGFNPQTFDALVEGILLRWVVGGCLGGWVDGRASPDGARDGGRRAPRPPPPTHTRRPRSIQRAHDALAPGSLRVGEGELLDANINRSPTAYEANPQGEREAYRHNVDKGMTLLRVEDEGGRWGRKRGGGRRGGGKESSGARGGKQTAGGRATHAGALTPPAHPPTHSRAHAQAQRGWRVLLVPRTRHLYEQHQPPSVW